MEKKIFIKRSYYLDLLAENLESFRKGSAKNVALLGPRKSGKTTIVKEHLKNAKDIVCAYVDLERISLNPENFSVELIGNVAFSFLKKPLSQYKKFMLLEHLSGLQEELKSRNAFSIIKSVENELLKIKPSQKLLVENAFKFAEALARDSGKKILVVFDNFEHILDLNNFSQVKDVISIINFEDANVNYIVTSSAIRESLAILKNFECYEIKNLERKDAIELIEGVIGKNPKASEEIFELTSGHPYAAWLVAKRFNEVKDAKKAFLAELLQKNSPLYNFCNESFNYYYNRARGQTLLKTILKVVANEELRLSDIARKIYRSAPVTKSVLERLMAVDVICKKDNKFCFSDNVLRLWVKFVSQNYSIDEMDDKMLEEAAKEL